LLLAGDMELLTRKVEVTLIDDRSGTVMAVTSLAPDALPEAFFAATTLHLGNADWSVVSADPMDRAAYAKTGKLVLRLRPIEQIDPKQLLFSLPTICDQLPASEGSVADGSEVVLREDDWRQCELVSEAFGATVEHELDAVREIHEKQRAGPGFRKLQVRSALPQPIAEGAVQFADVRALGEDGARLPLRFDGSGRRISDGFACRLDSAQVLYGVAAGPSVEILAVQPGADFARLRAFAAERRLLAVDWCRCLRGHPNDDSFDALLGGVG
jgi:hypothetical protein